MGVKHLKNSNSQRTPGYAGIHIKPSHRGLLHKDLGIPEGRPIPASKLVIRPGDSPALQKRKQFAQNAKKFNR